MTNPLIVLSPGALAKLASVLLFLLGSALRIDAAEFICPSGNITCLIAAIDTANSTAEEDTILLEPGTYTLTAVDNNTDGPNGLPSIRTPIVIDQHFEGATLIERDLAAAPFRIFHIAEGGRLETGVIIVFGGGGSFGATREGGGILNHGQLIFRGTLLRNAAGDGGGLANRGTASLIDARVEQNIALGAGVGGVVNFGNLTITGSLIAGNSGSVRGAGGISNTGVTDISNSRIESNMADPLGNAGAIVNRGPGELTVTNSTILRNRGVVGGIWNDQSDAEPVLRVVNSSVIQNIGMFGGIGGIRGGTIINSTIVENIGGFGGIFGSSIQNTIVAANQGSMPECSRAVSLGNNIIGDISRCTILLQPGDLVGDPRLGEFVDQGIGRGYFPLLSDSPAIDAGNTDHCPSTDQLSNPRVGVCDIGSVEFQDGKVLVFVDVRPRSDANRINPASSKSLNVAVFSRNGFDANSIDISTVRFGATGTEAAPIDPGRRDVDADGKRDLVLRFQIQDMGIQCGDISATLTGQIAGGGPIIGSSPITTVQCQPNSLQVGR